MTVSKNKKTEDEINRGKENGVGWPGPDATLCCLSVASLTPSPTPLETQYTRPGPKKINKEKDRQTDRESKE